jgi:hypothetical protein
MKRGVLEVKSIYVKPDSSARPICSFRVLCACCGRRGGGSGSRSTARAELRAAGWRFDNRLGGWACDTCAKPTITRVEPGRYRVEGGALSADWSRCHAKYLERERAAGREVPTGPPWCEVTVELEGTYAGMVGSFGGAVWPGAWPDLFTVSPQRPDGDGTTRLTALGLRRFSEVTQ